MFEFPYYIGERVQSCLDCECPYPHSDSLDGGQFTGWYEGTINSIVYEEETEGSTGMLKDTYRLSILRDDGNPGSGINGGWQVFVNIKNFKYIKPLEWDTKENYHE